MWRFDGSSLGRENEGSGFRRSVEAGREACRRGVEGMMLVIVMGLPCLHATAIYLHLYYYHEGSYRVVNRTKTKPQESPRLVQ